MSSLGREGQGAAASLESQASSKLEEGRLYPQYASAKAAIAKDVVNFAAEIRSWENARQEAKAIWALSQYHTKLAQAESEVANARSYKASDVPENVKIERFQKSEDGTDVERTGIPQWEVAPGMFDHYEKPLAEQALAEVRDGPVKQKLSMQIAERRTQGQLKMKTIHYKGSLEYMQDKLLTAATDQANAGNTQLAVQAIEAGVKNGTFSLDEGRKQTKSILAAGDETRARRELLATNDPAQLEAMQNKLLATTEPGAANPYPHLDPMKRLSIAQTIDTKRIELEKAGMTRAKQERTMAADRAIIEAGNAARAGRPWTPEQIQATASKLQMTNTDEAALRKASEGGIEVKTNKAGDDGLRLIQSGLATSIMPKNQGGSPMNVEESTDYWRSEVERLYSASSISSEDRARTLREIDAWSKGVYESPQHKDAESLIKDLIPKNSSKFAERGLQVVRVKYLSDLREAKSQNPKLDSVRWVQDNEAAYRKLEQNEVWKEMARLGVTQFVKVNNTDQRIDAQASLDRLKTAREKNTITPDKYRDAVNALTSVNAEIR